LTENAAILGVSAVEREKPRTDILKRKGGSMSRPRFLAFGLLFAVCVLTLFLFGCGDGGGNLSGPQGVDGLSDKAASDPSRARTAMEVQDRYTGGLLALEGVVGTAIGLDSDGEVVIRIYTLRPGISGIPERLEDIPVQVQVSGEIRALKKPSNPGKGDREKTPSGKGFWERPVPTGVSVGNIRECVSGTIGCVVKKDGKPYILSNNHVLAIENSGQQGDPIVQPGVYDNKPPCRQKPQNKVASLSEWVDIDWNGNNTMDAAIAVSDPPMVACCTYTTEYGCPSSQDVAAYVGMNVQKVGRTTGHTVGAVDAVHATFLVGYGSRTATFIDQIVVLGSGFLRSGDSGSLLVTVDENDPVGLLFAGNNASLAIANPIGPILSHFDVTVCTN